MLGLFQPSWCRHYINTTFPVWTCISIAARALPIWICRENKWWLVKVWESQHGSFNQAFLQLLKRFIIFLVHCQRMSAFSNSYKGWARSKKFTTKTQRLFRKLRELWTPLTFFGSGKYAIAATFLGFALIHLFQPKSLNTQSQCRKLSFWNLDFQDLPNDLPSNTLLARRSCGSSFLSVFLWVIIELVWPLHLSMNLTAAAAI